MILSHKTVHPSQRAAEQFDNEHKQFESQIPDDAAAAAAAADDAGAPPPADPDPQPKQALNVEDDDSDLFDPNDPVLSKIKGTPAKRTKKTEGAPPSDDGNEQLTGLSAQIAEMQRRQDEERAQWRREREELTATRSSTESQDNTVQDLQEQISNLQAALQSSSDQNLAFELDNLIDVDALMQSENIDRDAARELAERALKPMAAKLRKAHDAAVEQATRKSDRSITATREELDAQIKQIQETQARNQRRTLNREIRRAHPDFDNLKGGQDFKEFQMRTPPGSRTPFGDEIREAYEDGDADHVISVIQIFKDGRNDVNEVTDVDMSAGTPQKTVGDQPANNATLPHYTYNDLNDWRYEYQRGEITQTVYQKRLRAFEKAENDGRVS